MRGDLAVWAVADGVGGKNAGEVASALAVEALVAFFEASRGGGWPDEYRALLDLMLAPGAQRLCAGVRKANREVHARANGLEEHVGMGTTIVALHLSPGHAHVAHVGDSRCYRLRHGTLELLTRDHSVENEPLLYQRRPGDPPPSRRNVITRALGLREGVEVDVRTLEAEPGDAWLLCSDGLTRMVDDASIGRILVETSDPPSATARLVSMANEAGGHDNITALFVELPR